MKRTIGDNLKIARMKSGCSLNEAGKRLGISSTAIFKYEKKKNHRLIFQVLVNECT